VLSDKAENRSDAVMAGTAGETSLLDARVALGAAPAAVCASVAANVDCNAASIVKIDNRTIVRKYASPSPLIDGL
jgi:hypothetical protein